MANSDPNNGEKSSSDAEIKVINKIPRTPPKPTHTSRRNTVSIDMGYTGPQKTIFIAQTSKPKNML